MAEKTLIATTPTAMAAAHTEMAEARLEREIEATATMVEEAKRLEARVAELESELEEAETSEDAWQAEAERLQARVAELEADLSAGPENRDAHVTGPQIVPGGTPIEKSRAESKTARALRSVALGFDEKQPHYAEWMREGAAAIELLAAESGTAGPPYTVAYQTEGVQADIEQASTGGPDFTYKPVAMADGCGAYIGGYCGDDGQLCGACVFDAAREGESEP